MRTLLFTLLSLACSVVLAATVYKWIDENGVVHYSDQPHPNAEKVHVQAVQTYKSGPYDAGGGAGSLRPGRGTAPAAYAGCAIAQPADTQNYPNVESLSIVVRTDPSLHPGDQIFLMLDGAPLNNAQPVGTQFTLSPVERGTHTLQAVVRDGNGGLMCQTPAVTFSVTSPRSRTRPTPSSRTEARARRTGPAAGGAGSPWRLSRPPLRRLRTLTRRICSMRSPPAS